MNHQPQLTDGFGGDVFIARQPIFDRNNQVFAYELLYRGGTAHNASNVQEGNETTRTKLDGDTATARVVLTAFVDMGIDKITGGKKAFLNFTKTFLNKTYVAALPRTKVVIELLENIEVTPEVVTATRALKKAGYTIALDDFFYDSKYEPLLELADIVKVDITLMSLTELKQHVSQIKKHQQIKLLAEKVETQAEQKACMDMGFDYFQGYFFAKPNIMATKSLKANKLAVLELLASIFDPMIDLRKLSTIISRDVALSHKLLSFVQQETSRADSDIEINSVHDAVLRFGLERLQSWISVMAMAQIDDKPPELYHTLLNRAQFMSNICEALKDGDREVYFTVGLFSLLDAMLDVPMEEALAKLPLSKNVRAAILRREGKLGRALATIESIERNDAGNFACEELEPGLISACYLRAVEWSNSLGF